MGYSSKGKFFKLYPVGREIRSWGNIGTFRSLRSQSTAEIFLARKLMGGVHNAQLFSIRMMVLNMMDKNRLSLPKHHCYLVILATSFKTYFKL